MKTLKIAASLALMLSMGLSLNSCKKKEVDNDTQSSVDLGTAKLGYSTILPVINQIGIDDEGVNKTGFDICANVYYTTADTVMDWATDVIGIAVDYGTGCVDTDGRTKSGRILLTFTDTVWTVPGGKITATLENFYVDGIRYDGTAVATRTGLQSMSFRLDNGTCYTDSWTILYDGESTITQTSGFNTPSTLSDDVFSITEDLTCTNRDGRTFTVTTQTPIVKKVSCKWITSGQVDVTPTGLNTRSFDFGSGTCDATAIVDINGNRFTFNMN